MGPPVVLKAVDFNRFFEKLSQRFDVYFPIRKKDQRFFTKFTSQTPGDPVIGEIRPFEPLKAFFSRARERVADDFNVGLPRLEKKPVAVLGVKACDLKGMQIQDHVFKNNGTNDPFYVENREKTLIIGADCTSAIDTCFCLALGVQPYPQSGFDLNFSTMTDGFIIEAGSSRGEAILEECGSFLSSADEAARIARDAQRAQVKDAVQENLKKFNVPTEDTFDGIIEKNFKAPVWEEEAKTCVECGACTIICPTCHCFLLYDQKGEERMARLRIWDSCMIKDYARVAGGANPRKRLWMRLRNRFEKKFDFFPKIMKVYACTGCGRCITACPAKIDIRRVLRKLVEYA